MTVRVSQGIIPLLVRAEGGPAAMNLVKWNALLYVLLCYPEMSVLVMWVSACACVHMGGGGGVQVTVCLPTSLCASSSVLVCVISACAFVSFYLCLSLFVCLYLSVSASLFVTVFVWVGETDKQARTDTDRQTDRRTDGERGTDQNKENEQPPKIPKVFVSACVSVWWVGVVCVSTYVCVYVSTKRVVRTEMKPTHISKQTKLHTALFSYKIFTFIV